MINPSWDSPDVGTLKAWQYVGRFLWSFASVESVIDNILEVLLNLNAPAFVLITDGLQFHKKVSIAEIGLKKLEKPESQAESAFKNARGLATLRNCLAHSWFEHVEAFDHTICDVPIHFAAGVDFAYVKDGKLCVPHVKPIKTARQSLANERKELILAGPYGRDFDEQDLSVLDESTITYDEFDKYFLLAQETMKALAELPTEPISDAVAFARDISQIIASSDNVVLFPGS
jgi:hypothetical protein